MNAVVEVTAPYRGTSRRHTSEPRWATDRPVADPAGDRHLLVTGVDPGAARAAVLWQAEVAETGGRLEVLACEASEIGASIATALRDTGTGTRLLVAGDETVIAAAVAAGLAGGLAPAEMRVQLTDPDGPRPVQCVHCRVITATTTPVDGIFDCSGCAAPLLVFPHYSRRLGAYLAFHAEAEELA